MHSATTAYLFELFDTPEHRDWKADRILRRRVPLSEAWRGCVGLAVLLDRPDDTEAHGDLALVRNEQLTWLAMRDVPVGHYPRGSAMGRRDVRYVNAAVSELRYGMPVIDFHSDARDAVDFRFMPFAAHRRRFGPCRSDVRVVRPAGDTLDSERQQREFTVLNRVSAAMTALAFFGTDQRGRAVRRAWAAHRPQEGRMFTAETSFGWMPRPYLALPAELAGDLYRMATNAEVRDTAWECPACHEVMTGAGFGRRASGTIHLLNGGDFLAGCARCGRRARWRLADGRPCRVRRKFGIAFRDGFCRAMAAGLPVCTLAPEVYCGPCRSVDNREMPADDDGVRLDLVAHRLRCTSDGRKRLAFLPRRARVTARVGQALDAGIEWAAALGGPPSARWIVGSPDDRWATASETCGGRGMASYLQRLWFEHQLVRLPDAALGQVLVPAELVAPVARDLQPAGLWWDTAPALAHYDWEVGAAVFPPIRVGRWDALRLALPGDVAVDATVADPRCDVGRRYVARSSRSARPLQVPEERRHARLAG
jgi:hypothetical protein